MKAWVWVRRGVWLWAFLCCSSSFGAANSYQPEIRYWNFISDPHYFCEDPADCGNHYAAELLRQLHDPGQQYVVTNVEISAATPSNAETLNGKFRYFAFTKRITTRGPTGELSSVTYQDGYWVSAIEWCPNGSHTPVSVANSPHQVIECKPTRLEPAKDASPIVCKPVFGENGEKWQRESDYRPSESLLSIVRIWYGPNGRFSFPIDDHLSGLPTQIEPLCNPGVWMSEPDSKGRRQILPACFRYLSRAAGLVQRTSTGESLLLEGTVGGTRFATSGAGKSRVLTLTGNGSATVRTEGNLLELFDGTGKLISRTAANGQFVTHASQPSPTGVGNRHVIRSWTGREIKFDVAGSFVRKAIDAAEGEYLYTHGDAPSNCVSADQDACSRLTGVQFPDGSTRTYHYSEPSHVQSAASVGRPLLTGITDENGVRLANFHYGSDGRVLRSGWGGHEYALSYSQLSTTVTDLNGATSRTYYEQIGDFLAPTSTSQPAGSGCAAAYRSQASDVNGNPIRRNDFRGNRTCFGYEALGNREIARIEGLEATATCPTFTSTVALPSGSRMTSRQWHPDWNFEIRRAEPGVITTYVYNGQPDPFNGNAVAGCAPTAALLPDGKPIAVLCRQVEQATTDVNGSQGFSATLQAGVANREQQWTYNQHGQVLTHDGPRNDVNDVTTYAYYSDTSFTGTGSSAVGHTIGDLQSVTNAAGQVTQFTQYDKHGQLLESVDPNGMVTTNTYDLRQRLLSTTVGGQTTNYIYDAAGQLKRVTRPDGSYVGFDYDPAHRQTAVYDNLGNRIDYTLDNAGNRTGEAVKDSSGALLRQLARSIDAIGRVQQVTGRE